MLIEVITEREPLSKDVALQTPLAGLFGSSLREWVLVQAVFDRVFWSFRLDCKLPKGRDQMVEFLLGFSHGAKPGDGWGFHG